MTKSVSPAQIALSQPQTLLQVQIVLELYLNCKPYLQFNVSKTKFIILSLKHAPVQAKESRGIAEASFW